MSNVNAKSLEKLQKDLPSLAIFYRGDKAGLTLGFSTSQVIESLNFNKIKRRLHRSSTFYDLILSLSASDVW